jgi:predicted membrane channel-forming protein YqfA (hemolysin III family)
MAYEINSPEYKKAKRKVKEIKEFYQHLLIYIVVVGSLVALNAFTVGLSQGVWWVQWVVFGWGIGIIGHWVSVFGFMGMMGSEWEEKKIQELIEKEK